MQCSTHSIYHTPIYQYSSMLREFWHGFLDEKSNRLVMPRALRDSERQRQRQWYKKKKRNRVETEKLRSSGTGFTSGIWVGVCFVILFFSFWFFFFVYPRNFRRCISTHSTVPAIYLVFSRRLRCVFHLLSFDSFCSNSIAIGNDKKTKD